MSKMRQYHKAGVRVVWLIYPGLQEVHVYSGEHLDQMTVCSEDRICSAAPALPDFEVSVREVFKKEVETQTGA